MNDDTPDLREPVPQDEARLDGRQAAVLAAMTEIQNRKPGWMRAVILFLVSLSLFAGAGALSDSLRVMGMLVGILIIHELGHYLAMRWFGYRNVKMFFIPFFGAAVSGQHFNVAGWKKVVVSLLGPIPGIVLGILLGSFAIYLKQNPAAANISHELLLEFATISIVINGFNLLPILPLDGGWIMHALIFCRHPVFDAGFRIIASLMMLFLGIAMRQFFFAFLGGFLLFGIPITYRMARLARRLRTEGVHREAGSEGTIRPETATKIIDGVEAVTRHAASPKIVATHSLQVFETLNATPPGIIASLFFLIVHGLSLFVAVSAGFVLIIERETSFQEYADLYMSAPKLVYFCETVETWQSKDWVSSSADEKLLLIAHRDNAQLAVDEFTSLSERPPSGGKLTLFGQTLLVEVKDAAAHDAWEKQLRLGGDVLPRGLVSVRVQCSLGSPKGARNCVQDCEDYIDWFSTPDWLAPPWSHPENLTAAGLERLRLARRTFQKVRDKEDELGVAAEVGEVYAKEIAPAALANDQQRVDELVEQRHKEQLANFKNAVQELRGTVSSPVEIQVLDLMLKHEMCSPFESGQPEPPPELADLFGRFDRDADGGIALNDAGSRCFNVEAKHAAFLLAIEVESFESTTVGLTRLSHWLCRRGAQFIQYDITTKPDPLAMD